MDKNTLLQKLEHNKGNMDERERGIKLTSFYKAFNTGYIIIILLIGLRSFTETPFYSDLGILLAGQAGSMSYFLYQNGRNQKLNLIMIIASATMFALFTFFTVRHYGFI